MDIIKFKFKFKYRFAVVVSLFTNVGSGGVWPRIANNYERQQVL